MQCHKHPIYNGAKKPTDNCKKCWLVYYDMHNIIPLNKKELKKLINTEDNFLIDEFPQYPRRFLRNWKRKTARKQYREDTNDVHSLIHRDRRLKYNEERYKELEKKYFTLIEDADALKREKEAIIKIKKEISVDNIKPKKKGKNGEGVVVIVASDWHYEERVEPATVNELNEYNLEIADQRINNFWKNSLKLIRAADRDNNIHTIVLALLGDFISSSIHDELMEVNQLLPTHAIRMVQQKILGGINMLLNYTDKKIVVHCISGNHTRITDKMRNATFSGYSLEDYMYHNIKNYYHDEKRIKFNIPLSYLSYLDVMGYSIRFHHGYGIRYRGGVGGIYIPANKAISQWNKGKNADIDVFGHWHQLKDGGNFLINGSIIGYNAYAMSIKADYEEPRQLFFLINKYGRTGYTKIVV